MGPMRRPMILWILALPVFGLLSGCLATRSQVVGLEDRLVKVEKAHAGYLVNADRETKRLQTLATQVEESNAQLRDSLARSGAKLGDFETRLAKLRGELEVVVHRLDGIEKTGGGAAVLVSDVRRRLDQLIADLRDRAGIAILALPADLPADADGFAKLADAKLVSGDIRTAAAVASECQKRFANTEPAGQCGIVLARIALQEQRYADATRILQAVHDSLAGKAVPVVGQALLEIAKILEIQGRCANAQKVLKYVLSDLPKVPAAKAARELLTTSAARCKEGVGSPGKPAGEPGKPSEGDAQPEAAPAPSAPVKADAADKTADPPAPAGPAGPAKERRGIKPSEVPPAQP